MEQSGVMEIRDKEIRKEIVIFNQLFICSNFGVIYNRHGKPLTEHLDRDGYKRVRITNPFKEKLDKRVNKLLHRVVYKAFNPEIDMTGLTINHEDGNKLNNNITNLSLITFAENNKHAYRTGLKDNKGEKHGNSHFKETNILTIRELYNSGAYTQREIANLYKVGQSRISEIIKNKIWKHIQII